VRKTLVDRGALPGSARVLLGGIEPAPFLAHSRLLQPGRRGPVELLYFGRLIRDKGVHTAIEALGRLKTRNSASSMRLTILGSGHPDYENAIRQLVRRLDLADRVTFVPQIRRHEIPEWLGRFDVFLFTSIWPEPMARTVMEAMAAGLLVIGTDVGGQAEMLSHGENSLTFPPGDAEGLAERLAAVDGDPAAFRRLARAGQDTTLQRFTLSRMADEIEGFLRETLETQ
jgi:D-inositol-3-phosphate glycosyltransferase